VSQLPISLEVNRLCDFASFLPGRNDEVVAALEARARGTTRDGLWLFGAAGSGKSHLLQAACQAGSAAGRRCLYVPLGALPRDPAIFENLEGELLALDDVDGWVGCAALETELVALYQRLQGAGSALLCAAARPPAELPFALPDLASRLRGLPRYGLREPDDTLLKAILKEHGSRQGLELADATLEFWLTRSPRALPTLLAQLRLLDRAALAGKRRVTIPFLKEVLRL
jgi:DnaA family protein